MPKKTENPDIANCKCCGKAYYKKGGNTASQRTCWICIEEKKAATRKLFEASL